MFPFNVNLMIGFFFYEYKVHKGLGMNAKCDMQFLNLIMLRLSGLTEYACLLNM